MKKIAFVGHGLLSAKNLPQRLIETITAEIQNGYSCFIMGTHGEFDSLALSICRKLRNTYNDINIEVVITSLNSIKPKDYIPYSDVKTVMYDIENVHYKRQISYSNINMIDECDTLICYVNEKVYMSGAKASLQYAKKKNIRIINLYREDDEQFYGMTNEQIKKSWLELCDKVLGKK